MIEMLMIVVIVLLIISIVVTVEIDKDLKKMFEASLEQDKKAKRIHPKVSGVNFDNVLAGRNDAYKKYQNKDGLYEPIRSKNGIEIKTRKEE